MITDRLLTVALSPFGFSSAFLFFSLLSFVCQYMTIYSSTQSCMSIQGSTQRLLNACHPDAKWSVSVLTPQLGGGFGGKETQSSWTALGAAFCASELGQDVRFVLSRDADMRIIGHRHPMDASFTVAADRSTGRIAAMEIVLDADAGCTYDATLPVVDLAILTSENAYLVDVFCARVDSWFTNKASSTAMRSFGVVQSLQVTEYAIERVCEQLTHLSPFLIRSTNFFPYRDQAGTFPVTPYGQEVKYANLDGVWADMDDMMLSMAKLQVFDGVRERVEKEQLAKDKPMLLSQEQVQSRSTADASAKARVPVAATGSGFDHITALVHAFNASSTHQKLGLSVLPLKYGISYTIIKLNVGECVIQITDVGQVVLQCPGVEMGQGHNTSTHTQRSIGTHTTMTPAGGEAHHADGSQRSCTIRAHLFFRCWCLCFVFSSCFIFLFRSGHEDEADCRSEADPVEQMDHVQSFRSPDEILRLTSATAARRLCAPRHWRVHWFRPQRRRHHHRVQPLKCVDRTAAGKHARVGRVRAAGTTLVRAGRLLVDRSAGARAE